MNRHRASLRASSLLSFVAASALSLPALAQTQPNPYYALPPAEAAPAATPGAAPAPTPAAPPVPSTEALVAAPPAAPAATAVPAAPPAAVDANEPRLNLYGFADLPFYKYFLHEDNGFRSLLYTESAFAVGNLNLYLSSNLGSGWSSMAEVRFSYLPNGSRKVVNGDIERTETN